MMASQIPFAISVASPAHTKLLSKRARILRLLASTLDPRAWAHMLKLVNYYNYSHVQPKRKIQIGAGAQISPNATFSNPERITIGKGLLLGARCHLWAGPSTGRIVIGDDVTLGPDIMVTAANYRFNDGQPVSQQAMDEADVIIGDDVWVGAGAVILPGVSIDDGAIVGAGAVISRDISAMSIAVGNPASIVGQRNLSALEEQAS